MKITRLTRKTTFPLFLVFMAIPHFAGAQSTPPPSSRPPRSAPAPSKGSANTTTIKNMIDSGNYVFQAQSALPMRGNIRQLTTDNYTLKVNPEKITSDLPYFGRAYTAPIDPTRTGIQFTTKDFDYKITPGKKEGWNVLIKPKDYKDVQQLQLSISSAGYATLQVISASRESITFNGIITAPGTH
jgi:hypothetical protein